MKRIFPKLLLALIITSSQVSAQTSPVNPGATTPSLAPKLTIRDKDNTHDFGKIPQGKPVTYIFVVINTGKTPLLISAVNSVCTCIVFAWTKSPIEPGQLGKVTVTYNTAVAAPFSKSITVVSNDPNPQNVLTIRGEVMPAPESSSRR